MIWLSSPRRSARAYRGPTSLRSLCGQAPLLDRPAGEYAETGRVLRETEPSDPCLACLAAWRRHAA